MKSNLIRHFCTKGIRMNLLVGRVRRTSFFINFRSSLSLESRALVRITLEIHVIGFEDDPGEWILSPGIPFVCFRED